MISYMHFQLVVLKVNENLGHAIFSIIKQPWSSSYVPCDTVNASSLTIFVSTVHMYRKSLCTTPGIRVGSSIGVSKMLNFTLKVCMQ